MARPPSIASNDRTQPVPPGSYLSRISALVPNSRDHAEFLAGHKETRPQIWYVSPSSTTKSQWLNQLFDLVPRGQRQQQQQQQPRQNNNAFDPRDGESEECKVCVIEDVSPEMIRKLGEVFDIDPAFFATHLANPDESELWQIHNPDTIEDAAGYQHLTGVWEYLGNHRAWDALKRAMERYNRRLYGGDEWPIGINTKISYCRLSRYVYLFLVDAPPPLPTFFDPEDKDQIILRFSYARNNGGLLLPRVEEPQALTVCEMLVKYFQRRWAFTYLYRPTTTFPRVPLLYVLCYTGWFMRYKDLESRVRQVSFREIKNGARLNDTVMLHEMREELAILRDGIDQTLACVAPAAVFYFEKLGWHVYSAGVNDETLFDGLRSILLRSANLNQLLLETFQILMNTVAIQDAKSSLQLAKSSLLLARLAAIYLPLSLAVGIFGMNLAELNSSGQPVWVFVVTALVMALLTVCVAFYETITQFVRNVGYREDMKML